MKNKGGELKKGLLIKNKFVSKTKKHLLATEISNEIPSFPILSVIIQNMS